jgi:DNA-binding beta-propeller fold protein YncE
MSTLRALVVLAVTLATVTASAAQLYWNDETGINRSNLDGSNPQLLVPAGPPGISGIAADPSTNTLYWLEGNQPSRLRRSNLDGTNPQTVINVSAVGTGIAVHPSTHEVWWVGALNANQEVMLRTSPDGATTTFAFDPGNDANQFFIDPAADKLYSLNTDDGGITRFNFDGTSDFLVDDAESMAFDLPGGKMYFALDNSGTIFRANLDGSNVEAAMTLPVGAWTGAMALDPSSQTLFIGSIFPFGIYRVNLDGSGLEPITTPAAPVFQLLIVPEPSTLAMLLAALPLGYLAYRRRRTGT